MLNGEPALRFFDKDESSGGSLLDGDSFTIFKKGGFALQSDKNDYRGVLTGLEGVTGKKAVDSAAMTVKN
jgi:hypothetical protein